MGTRDEQDRVLLTADEAAKFLNVSQATVYRLLQKGILEKVKKQGTRAWFITLESLEAYGTATNFTLPELAARLLRLERKIDFLTTQVNSAEPSRTNEVKTTVTDFALLQREMKKRFGNLPREN